MKPIFLISLPRSGSTLLQKILMSHKDIASSAEPWFLLPLIYTYKDKGIKTEYGQKSSTIALKYLKNNYFNDKYIYEKQIKEFILNIYKDMSNGKQYFLDKTPRYYWILDDLQKLFPEAKFIVLLRNPISIFASTIEAFHNNSIKRLDHADNDFYIGPKKISKFLLKNQNNKNVIPVTYEDIVQSPEIQIKKICNALEIDFHKEMLDDFYKKDLKGFGDHLGAKQFTSIQNNSEKWKKILNSKIRKILLKEYIKNYDEKYIELWKGNKSDLLKTVEEYNPKKFGLYEIKDFCKYKIIKIIKNVLNYKSLS